MKIIGYKFVDQVPVIVRLVLQRLQSLLDTKGSQLDVLGRDQCVLIKQR